MTVQNQDSENEALRVLLKLVAEGHTLEEIKTSLVAARELQDEE